VITIQGQELIAVLKDMLRTASSDTSFPMMNSVHLHQKHNRLYITSTNRHTLAQCWTEVGKSDTAMLDDEVNVPATLLWRADVYRLQRQLEARTSSFYPRGEVTLSREGDTFVVEDELDRLTLPISPAVFPGHIARIVGKAMAAGPGDFCAMNASFLKELALIAWRRQASMDFVLGNVERNQPSVIRIGPQYQALIMPIRKDPEPYEWSFEPFERQADA